MRTLYLSDLDGTLLHQSGRLTDRTVEILNALIDNGVTFSFATARTASTALPLTARLHLKHPVILQNGVLILDPISRMPLKQWSLPRVILPKLVSVLEDFGMPAFIYGLEDSGNIHAYYTHESKAMTIFRLEREQAFNKQFDQVSSLRATLNQNVTYITMMDVKEKLDPVFRAIKTLPVQAQYYQDVYHDGIWFLEIYHQEASKGTAAAELRKMVGADIIVAFGDNYNDLSLFQAAHHRVAVGNAVPELQDESDIVIGPQNADSVPKYIAQYRKAHHDRR